jgi:four helix bundle protein
MSRVRGELLERVEAFGDRGLQLAEALDKKRIFRRVSDQIAGCFTSVGANVYEGHEAMSDKDFVRAMGVAIKEASESRYWIRMAIRRKYFQENRLRPLEQEAQGLIKIFGAIIFRTKRRTPSRKPV